ncbi:MAG TPA: response regulator [Rhodospirillaceae bacterium]|nr:response regulator [Rhodospirillaceae bacterium]
MNKHRALVAEDNVLALIGLEDLLADHGIDIVGPASTVTEALALADSEVIDIAVLDVNLHNQMVYPVADLLSGRGIPVIFLTGYLPEEILPSHYLDMPSLQKPYDDSALIALIQATLDRGDVAD